MNTKIFLFLLVAVFTVALISDVMADPSAEANPASLSRSKRSILQDITNIILSLIPPKLREEISEAISEEIEKIKNIVAELIALSF